ncbi:hypothetical protein [Companilactobacillus heilongjiangensis]|nr:hypothetical protein [Companilactobacillus heilongjiangensis]
MDNLNEYLGGRIIQTTDLKPEVLQYLQSCGGKVVPTTFKKNDNYFAVVA